MQITEKMIEAGVKALAEIAPDQNKFAAPVAAFVFNAMLAAGDTEFRNEARRELIGAMGAVDAAKANILRGCDWLNGENLDEVRDMSPAVKQGPVCSNRWADAAPADHAFDEADEMQVIDDLDMPHDGRTVQQAATSLAKSRETV